jgi:hypothetical protein
VSHLEKHWKVQLELPLGLEDEKRRPGTKRGMARWTADRAVDMIRDRFGWDAVGFGSVMLGLSGPFPMSFVSSPKRTCKPLAMTYASWRATPRQRRLRPEDTRDPRKVELRGMSVHMDWRAC